MAAASLPERFYELAGPMLPAEKEPEFRGWPTSDSPSVVHECRYYFIWPPNDPEAMHAYNEMRW